MFLVIISQISIKTVSLLAWGSTNSLLPKEWVLDVLSHLLQAYPCSHRSSSNLTCAVKWRYQIYHLYLFNEDTFFLKLSTNWPKDLTVRLGLIWSQTTCQLTYCSSVIGSCACLKMSQIMDLLMVQISVPQQSVVLWSKLSHHQASY
jgi:hypothetical protein